MIPKVLLLIKQIRSRTTQVYDLRTPIPIFFQSRALKAVERIRYSFTSAYDALVLVITEGAFVADARECGRSHVRIADRTLPVTFVAEPADGDARCFAAHDEIWVMARHVGEFSMSVGIVLVGNKGMLLIGRRVECV